MNYSSLQNKNFRIDLWIQRTAHSGIFQIFFFMLFFATISSAQPAPSPFTSFNRIDIDPWDATYVNAAIIQDQKGFIWLLNIYGLYRYDGYSFKIYRRSPEHPDYPEEADFAGMVLDSSGIFWIADS